jgi:hypothetical protein
MLGLLNPAPKRAGFFLPHLKPEKHAVSILIGSKPPAGIAFGGGRAFGFFTWL